MFGACAGCIPVMMGFQEKYKRLDIDKSSLSQSLTKAAKEVKETPENNGRAGTNLLGPIMSITHIDELVNRLKRSRESNL